MTQKMRSQSRAQMLFQRILLMLKRNVKILVISNRNHVDLISFFLFLSVPHLIFPLFLVNLKLGSLAGTANFVYFSPLQPSSWLCWHLDHTTLECPNKDFVSQSSANTEYCQQKLIATKPPAAKAYLNGKYHDKSEMRDNHKSIYEPLGNM